MPNSFLNESGLAYLIAKIKNLINNIPTPTAQDVGALPITGGTLTGNLTGKYITGTWLQSTTDNHYTSKATKFCVQDSSGWVYYRTAEEMLSDLGISPPKLVSVLLPVRGWSTSGQQSVTVNGILADETKQLIQVTPTVSNQAAYYACGISCIGQAENKLTFSYKEKPTSNIYIFVVFQSVSNS